MSYPGRYDCTAPPANCCGNPRRCTGAQDSVEQNLEELGVQSDEQEWAEYWTRVRFHKCTCDILVPYGHVTCRECNDG